MPCDGYYCRPIIAASFALSPIWIWFYLNDQFEVNIFSSFIGFILVVSNLLIAGFILRYSPDGEGPIDFIAIVSLPNALDSIFRFYFRLIIILFCRSQ